MHRSDSEVARIKFVVIMNKQELIKFLKENLEINIWCDYDRCDSAQVNVSLDLCGEEIHRSSDYLLKVN